MIPLTNWHLINLNELFSNFIIQHQELMREPRLAGWWQEHHSEVGWLREEGAGVTSGWRVSRPHSQELALGLRAGEGEGDRVGLPIEL